MTVKRAAEGEDDILRRSVGRALWQREEQLQGPRALGEKHSEESAGGD